MGLWKAPEGKDAQCEGKEGWGMDFPMMDDYGIVSHAVQKGLCFRWLAFPEPGSVLSPTGFSVTPDILSFS